MSEFAQFDGLLEVKAAADTPSRFEILAYTGGKLRVSGFDLPVVVDLDGLEASGQIPIAIQHETETATILGQTDPNGISNDGKSLTLTGPITADPELSPDVKRVLAMSARGHTWQASIGAQIEDSREVGPGETAVVNGQVIEGPFILATRSTLRETSVLGMGADKNTRVMLAASAGCDVMADALTGPDGGFEAWVRELGGDTAAMPEKLRNALIQQYAALNRDPSEAMSAEATDAGHAEPDGDEVNAEPAEEPDGDEVKAEAATDDDEDDKKKEKTMSAGADLDITAKAQLEIEAARKATANEFRRQHEIKAKFGSEPDIVATAIEKGWTLLEAENAYLKRKAEKRAPAGHVRETNGDSLKQALQGAMILRAGGKIDHDGFSGQMGLALGLPSWLRAGINSDQRQKAMEAAWKFREMSMVDLCKAACSIDGKDCDGTNQGFIRAAVSGGALADIFTTNINALLIQKLLEHPDTTAGWTRESDAANFQTMERTRLVKGPRLSLHARGGEADNAKRSDVMQSYKINRYSQKFSVDEQDIIDDRFQALQDIPNEMGLACARLRPDLVYSILLANGSITKEDGTSSALFYATQPGSQSNYDASGATLASGTLQTAMAKMFNFTENGIPINATPTHLIVPAQLFGTAASLLQSPTIVVAGTAGSVTTKGSVNEIQAMQSAWGLISIVSDSRLSNGVTDPATGTAYSGSASQWYLVSNKVPTIEVAYLRGSGRAPQVRQYMLDQGKWGMGWDVNMDIGAKAMAWQGFYSANT